MATAAKKLLKADNKRVYSFAIYPRGQRGDLNFKNDWQKEKVNYGQRLLNFKKDNKFRQSEDRSHEG